ncbi:unnamed protein product [Brassica oleracea var. botrytis]
MSLWWLFESTACAPCLRTTRSRRKSHRQSLGLVARLRLIGRVWCRRKWRSSLCLELAIRRIWYDIRRLGFGVGSSLKLTSGGRGTPLWVVLLTVTGGGSGAGLGLPGAETLWSSDLKPPGSNRRRMRLAPGLLSHRPTPLCLDL